MAWETSDTVTSAISVVALIASIGSYVHTALTTKTTRRYQYRLDRWQDLRTDIGKQVELLQECVAQLVVFGAENLDGNKEHIRRVHREAIARHLHLGRALFKAQLSEYAGDQPWSDLHLRPQIADNSAVDQIGEMINDRLDTCTTDADLAALGTDLLAIWVRMIDGIESAIRAQTYSLDPNYHG